MGKSEMGSVTYVKGIPTAGQDPNSLGFCEFEMFLNSYSQIFYQAACETVNHLLSKSGRFDKSKWNTYLQDKYGISKRHAGGIIAKGLFFIGRDLKLLRSSVILNSPLVLVGHVLTEMATLKLLEK